MSKKSNYLTAKEASYVVAEYFGEDINNNNLNIGKYRAKLDYYTNDIGYKKSKGKKLYTKENIINFFESKPKYRNSNKNKEKLIKKPIDLKPKKETIKKEDAIFNFFKQEPNVSEIEKQLLSSKMEELMTEGKLTLNNVQEITEEVKTWVSNLESSYKSYILSYQVIEDMLKAN
ncbi:MAG: hypothetical protein ACOCRX_00745 [Candidatus Woesearchaeota archaeon]